MLTPSEIQELPLLGYNGDLSHFDSWAVKYLRSLLFTNALLRRELEVRARGVASDDTFDGPWHHNPMVEPGYHLP